MKIENLVLLSIPLTLILISYFFIVDENIISSEMKILATNTNTESSTAESDDSENSNDKESEEFDELLHAYQEVQQQEEKAFKNKITQLWGEYKSSSAKKWVSYAESNKVRRTVDYDTGEVSIEVLLSDSSMIESKVKKLLEKETHKLLNTTEAEAFDTDELAQNIEKRLDKNNNVIKKGKPADIPLFDIDNLPELDFNYSAYKKISNKLKTTVNASIRKSKVKGKVIAQTKLTLDKVVLKKTAKYAKVLTQLANKQKISPALIYAIIETESNFNPMAKSHIPAYGLMQIVPATAGKDASKHLWGSPKILAPSYLYSSINNIHIGAAYLHVLYYKYLRKIKNSQSRVYCAIAAYNTGTTNVARAFIRQKNILKASRQINRLSSNQVYKKLIKRLPSRETRKYVKKVTKAMNNYWTLQKHNVI